MKHDTLDALRTRIRQIERRDLPRHKRLPTGYEPIDLYLGGGLMAGALHDFMLGSAFELGSTLAFMLPCLVRMDQPIFWLSCRANRLYAPGLDLYGLDRKRLFCLECDATRLLPVAEDILRHAEPMSLVIETDRALTLTEARRLNLAAEATGATGFMLRHGAGRALTAHEACACATRWRISAHPSSPRRLASLALPLPGPRRLSAALLKQRAGLPRHWTLDCPDHEPLSRSLDAILFNRTPAPPDQGAPFADAQARAASHEGASTYRHGR